MIKPLDMDLPKSVWVSLNRLRTGNGDFSYSCTNGDLLLRQNVSEAN